MKTKTVFLISLSFLIGYSISASIKIKDLTEEELNQLHVPKFKIGDCIKLKEFQQSTDVFEYRIVEILKNKDYGYTIGLDCPKAPDYLSCSLSASPSRKMDLRAIKIKCPEL